jgi:uroporphyrinogen-III synthase
VAHRADRPLVGIGVAVTREDGDEATLATLLRDHGATIVSWPAIRWATADPGPLDAALARLGEFHWAVLTSPRAVEAVANRDPSWPPGLRIAAVGGATRTAAEARGWSVHLVPSVQTAEALVDALADAGVGSGTRVLFPASEIARDTLEVGLRGLGAEVVRVTAYRTVPAELDRDACARAMAAGEVQVISFASPSAVEEPEGRPGRPAVRPRGNGAVMAVIGPTTAAAARAAGARSCHRGVRPFAGGAGGPDRRMGSEHARGAHELSDE